MLRAMIRLKVNRQCGSLPKGAFTITMLLLLPFEQLLLLAAAAAPPPPPPATTTTAAGVAGVEVAFHLVDAALRNPKPRGGHAQHWPAAANEGSVRTCGLRLRI